MAFDHQEQIAATLDLAKVQGLISEYLVSWRGAAGFLEPRVVVWSEPGAITDKLRGKLARQLFHLVPSENILVIDGAQAQQ